VCDHLDAVFRREAGRCTAIASERLPVTAVPPNCSTTPQQQHRHHGPIDARDLDSIDALVPDAIAVIFTEGHTATSDTELMRTDLSAEAIRLARVLVELIAEGHGLVRSRLRRNQPGPFQIQAAIAAVHADAPSAATTDWQQTTESCKAGGRSSLSGCDDLMSCLRLTR